MQNNQESVFMKCNPENINFEKELKRIAKTLGKKDSLDNTYYRDRIFDYNSSTIHTVYGVMLEDRVLKVHNIKEERNEKMEYFSNHVTYVSNARWVNVNEKNGIEVLGMTPNRTKNGKYTWDGTSIGELKKICKANGVKGYSRYNKCELVKTLMKL